MPPTQKLPPPEIKGNSVMLFESGVERAGCNEHPDGEIFDRYTGDSIESTIRWCLPPGGKRAHILEGWSLRGRMSRDQLLAFISGEPKHSDYA